MRPIILALVTSILVAPAARADELRHFEDAALRAVQFVDKDEGWTVGDEGVIWHTINGGKTWERQASGVVASLRSIHFLNPYTGWVTGREELPNGSASVGILLFTQDGGLTWRRTTLNSFPGYGLSTTKSVSWLAMERINFPRECSKPLITAERGSLFPDDAAPVGWPPTFKMGKMGPWVVPGAGSEPCATIKSAPRMSITWDRGPCWV